MKKTDRSILSLLLSFLLLALPLGGIAANAEGAPVITVIAEGNCGVMDENHEPTDLSLIHI